MVKQFAISHMDKTGKWALMNGFFSDRRYSLEVKHCYLLLGLFFLIGCNGETLMPTPNIYAGTDLNPLADVPAELQGGKMDILYVTDRIPEKSNEGKLEYGIGRSPSVGYGSCIVEIGKDLPWEQIVKQSRLKNRTQDLPLNMRATTEQGRLHPIPAPLARVNGKLVTEPAFAAEQKKLTEAFKKDIQRRLALTGRKDVFMYVHGFEDSFEDATTIMASLWHFMGRQGVPIAFTWPAGAGVSVRGYMEDYQSSRFAVPHLKWLLKTLAETPGVEKINIVAHSRGTDVACSALREMVLVAEAAGKDPIKALKIQNMVLAAPDMNVKVASMQMNADHAYDGIERMTVYTSMHDKAISLSEWLSGGGMRLGELKLDSTTKIQQKNMALRGNFDLVQAKIKAHGVGHAYFRLNPGVSSDLMLLLRDNRKPGTPGRPLTPVIPAVWSLDGKYPKSPPEK
jgi:esterase/lipase superfamily enzyme